MEDVTRFILKRKIKARGYYAEIFIKAETKNSRQLEVGFECDVGEYKDALRFGAQYFFECFERLGIRKD